jgi:hypothetical protein
MDHHEAFNHVEIPNCVDGGPIWERVRSSLKGVLNLFSLRILHPCFYAFTSEEQKLNIYKKLLTNMSFVIVDKQTVKHSIFLGYLL